MRSRICFAILVLLTTTAHAASADTAMSEYREALAEAHGPFVAVPTYLGAAVGAVALTPISLIYGTASLVLFRDNPARVAESWVTAPRRGWYWGGMVLGTPFRAVKAVLWDAPKALFRLFRRPTPPPPEETDIPQ
jgi:hypothetical protein